MSKLTDIKYRIDQLDGGTFQNLCDEYLTHRGYGTGFVRGYNQSGEAATHRARTRKRHILSAITTKQKRAATMVNDFYYDNLEQILAFTGGRNLLNIKEVLAFTGLKDYRAIHRRFTFIDGYISAATFARQLCGGKKKSRV